MPGPGDFPTRMLMCSMAVPSASPLPPPISVSSPRSGTRTAGPSAGLTAGLQQVSTRKARSTRSRKASAWMRRKGNIPVSMRAPRNGPWARSTVCSSTLRSGIPHTSCGCFEGIAFYIPEVDGFGIVLRGFRDVTVNGLAFSTMADSTAGGRQIDGFHGISIEYMRSPLFLHADGGYDRVVWMPAETKERLKDFIPAVGVSCHCHGKRCKDHP